ncbi:MAG: DNRLRE domain-containing protein [Bacillota bacterium]
MDEVNDLQSEIIIRQRLENKMSGRFILYRPQDDEIESSLFIKIRDNSSIESSIFIRTGDENELPASLDIKYRGNEYLESYIEAIAADEIEASIEVRPHNRMFGQFELIEAPRIEVNLAALEDASTRSDPDLETINYGDAKSMITGRNTHEEFEAFVSFGNLSSRIPDLKYLETAKLRLYYFNLPIGTNLELHQPNTLWRELGITHANKPYSTELLSNEYTINRKEYYIEFDVLDIANRWQSGDLSNYGFIIKTDQNETVSFFTRESDKSPHLVIKYITSDVYSVGRSQFDASMFIYGKGHKEIRGFLSVHSDVGFDWLESTLYVHRTEDPLFYELDSTIASTKRDLISELIVARRDKNEIAANLSIATKKASDVPSNLTSNTPDLRSQITVDPNASLKSVLTVAKNDNSDIDSSILVSKQDMDGYITVPTYTSVESIITVVGNENNDIQSHVLISRQDMAGHLVVSPYKRNVDNLSSFLTVKTTEEDDIDSSISISKQDLAGYIIVRELGEDDLSSKIEVPFYNDQHAIMHTSVPDVAASLMVKYMSQIDSTIWIKEAEYLESGIDIRQINEVEAMLTVKQIHETEADIAVNVPDLSSFLCPRVIGENDLSVIVSIRKKFVSDLTSTILIKGASNGAYYFII